MDRDDSLQKHASDMLAVVRHVHEAVQRQEDDDALAAHPEAARLVERIEGTLAQHVAGLETLATQVDADLQATLKQVATRLLGVAAGMLDQVRSQHPPPSRATCATTTPASAS